VGSDGPALNSSGPTAQPLARPEPLAAAVARDALGARLRGYLARAGLPHAVGQPVGLDWTGGRGNVWASEEVRSDPEVDVVDGDDASDPNVAEAAARAAGRSRVLNPLKASKKGG